MTRRFMNHPFENTLIDVNSFAEIKCCTVNLTHLDFYKDLIPNGQERGQPELIIKFESQEQRDEYFEVLSDNLTIDY